MSDTWKCGSLSFIFTHPREDKKQKTKKTLLEEERCNIMYVCIDRRWRRKHVETGDQVNPRIVEFSLTHLKSWTVKFSFCPLRFSTDWAILLLVVPEKCDYYYCCCAPCKNVEFSKFEYSQDRCRKRRPKLVLLRECKCGIWNAILRKDYAITQSYSNNTMRILFSVGTSEQV